MDKPLIYSVFALNGFVVALFLVIIFENSQSYNVNSNIGISYLIKYGYLPKTSNDNKIISTHSALRSFQKRFGLNATGQFDQSTISLMSRRRCGISDGIEGSSIQQRSGFQLYGSKWEKKKLTFDILSYTNQIDQNQVDAFGKSFV